MAEAERTPSAAIRCPQCGRVACGCTSPPGSIPIPVGSAATSPDDYPDDQETRMLREEFPKDCPNCGLWLTAESMDCPRCMTKFEVAA